MKKIPIIIDCDPGIDDSFAIALANYYEGFEIKAITAVEGNVPASVTRNNALCLPGVLGFDCRVGFGAELPLEKPYLYDAAFVHGESGVGTIVLDPGEKRPDEMPAWDLIYDEAVKANGELILFAVGPLTNIAIALRKHPDLPKYIKKFCIMGGGSFGNMPESEEKAEFNIFVDPHAAQEVFEQLEVYMVGLDATHASAIGYEEFDELIEICGRSEKNWFLKHIAEFSKINSMEYGQDNHVIHDALAIASMMDSEMVEFVDCHVEVETDLNKANNGQTYVLEEGKVNCHFGTNKVNQPAFFKLMKEMCDSYNN